MASNKTTGGSSSTKLAQTHQMLKEMKNATSTTNTQSSSNTTSSSSSVNDSSSNSSSSTHGVSRATGQVDANTQAQRQKALQDYQQSANVQAAYERLQSKLNSETGAFDSKYKQTLSDLYDQIANREKFSYNVNADALYQQYKDMYESQGKKAMEDAMAVNAALTGGYGSSYSQTAGQQAYQNYLEQLNDRIPELRNQAYQEYQSEAENLRNQFNMANSLYGNEYNEYRGDVADYQNERDFDYNQYAQNRNFWNSEYWNERNAEQTTDNNTIGTEYTHGTSSTNSTSNNDSTSKSTTEDESNSTAETNTTSKETANTSSWSNSQSSGSGGSGGSGSSSKKTSDKPYKDANRTNASKEGSTLYKSIVNAMAQAATSNMSLEDTNEARRDTLAKMYDGLRKQGKMSEDDYLFFLDMFKL